MSFLKRVDTKRGYLARKPSSRRTQRSRPINRVSNISISPLAALPTQLYNPFRAFSDYPLFSWFNDDGEQKSTGFFRRVLDAFKLPKLFSSNNDTTTVVAKAPIPKTAEVAHVAHVEPESGEAEVTLLESDDEDEEKRIDEEIAEFDDIMKKVTAYPVKKKKKDKETELDDDLLESMGILNPQAKKKKSDDDITDEEFFAMLDAHEAENKRKSQKALAVLPRPTQEDIVRQLELRQISPLELVHNNGIDITQALAAIDEFQKREDQSYIDRDDPQVPSKKERQALIARKNALDQRQIDEDLMQDARRYFTRFARLLGFARREPQDTFRKEEEGDMFREDESEIEKAVQKAKGVKRPPPPPLELSKIKELLLQKPPIPPKPLTQQEKQRLEQDMFLMLSSGILNNLSGVTNGLPGTFQANPLYQQCEIDLKNSDYTPQQRNYMLDYADKLLLDISTFHDRFFRKNPLYPNDKTWYPFFMIHRLQPKNAGELYQKFMEKIKYNTTDFDPNIVPKFYGKHLARH